MKKLARRSLSLQRTTLRTLGGADLAAAGGGTVQRTQICPAPSLVTATLTTLGPSAVDACPSALFCPGPGGPSIIVNPPERSL